MGGGRTTEMEEKGKDQRSLRLCRKEKSVSRRRGIGEEKVL